MAAVLVVGGVKADDSFAVHACGARISQRLWWFCAASLGQPQGELPRWRRTISVHSGPDRRAASIYPSSSRPEYHFQRSRAASLLPRHQYAPACLWSPRLPPPLALNRHSYFTSPIPTRDLCFVILKREPNSQQQSQVRHRELSLLAGLHQLPEHFQFSRFHMDIVHLQASHRTRRAPRGWVWWHHVASFHRWQICRSLGVGVIAPFADSIGLG